MTMTTTTTAKTIKTTMTTIKNKFFISATIVVAILMAVFATTTIVVAQTATSTPALTPTPTPITVDLKIESATSTLFSGSITVSACSPNEPNTPQVSGYCAVEQSGLETTWSSFGDAQFLESIEGAGNDYQNNLYWSWFADLEYGQVSLDQHILTPNENLLITLGRMPLKIVVSTTTPLVGATTTISVREFGFDDSWNGVWLPAAGSQINISIADQAGNGNEYAVNEQGNYEFIPNSVSPLTIFASKNGFLNSSEIVITPIALSEPPPDDSLDDGNDSGDNDNSDNGDSNDNNGSSGSDNSNDNNFCNFDINEAVRFLGTKQESDGSFGADIYTDWVAIALASVADNPTRARLTAFLKNEGGVGEFSSVTDYERHAMALMALRINPYTGTSINYIQKILDQFDGTQIGRPSLMNDDIFAIFPLIKAGYTVEDPIIQKITDFVILKQNSAGSWENSVDLTAAAIQALSLASRLDGVEQSMARARNFLVSHQQGDGGFGSSFSTSWAIQAILAMGESVSDWQNNESDPQDALCVFQQNDGGLEPPTTNDTTRIWATAYAIPAASGKTWANILRSFAKPTQNIVEDSDDERPRVQANEFLELNSVSTSSTFSTSLASSTLTLSDFQNQDIDTEAQITPPDDALDSTSVGSLEKLAAENQEITDSGQENDPQQFTAAAVESGSKVSLKTAIIFAIPLTIFLVLPAIIYFFKFKLRKNK